MGLWTVRRGCGGNQTLLRLLALHMATISLFHIALLVEAQDVAPPTWIAGYPVVASRTGTSVTLATQISEAGLVYAVVVPFGSTAPTPSEVKARTGHGGSTAVASASKDVLSAFKQTDVVLTSLQISTTYDVYLVAEDIQTPSNVQAAVVMLTFVTTNEVDTTPPQWLEAYPSLAEVSDTSATLELQLDEPCTVFHALLVQGAPAPSASALASSSIFPGFLAQPQGSVDVSAPAITTSHQFTGLLASTVYSIAVVARDLQAPPNLQATVVVLDFTTAAPPDEVAPNFVSGSPTVTSVTDSSFTLGLSMDEVGQGHVVVLQTPSAYPTASEVVLGQGHLGATALQAFTVNFLLPNFPMYHTVSGLNAAQSYDVYCVGEDASLNRMIVPSHVVVTTEADATPPEFVDGFPRLVSVTDYSAKVDVQLTEPGSIRYVIVKGHDITPAPTADDVAAASAGSSLTVVEAGAQAIPVALSTESLLSTALPASTAFTLFCVAEDGHTTPNRQSHVTAVGFTTAVDVTPPVIALGYPRVSEVSDASVTLSMSQSELGTCAMVVLRPDAPAPSAQQVMLLVNSSDVDTSSSGASAHTSMAWAVSKLIVNGLTADTDYVAWVAAQDKAVPTVNTIATPQAVAFRTLPDSTPPKEVMALSVRDITDTEGLVTTAFNEHGQCWVVACAQQEAAPSAAQVMQGLCSAGAALFTAHLHVNAHVALSVVVRGLPHEFPTAIYIVPQDDHSPVPNIMPVPLSVQFTTLPDATPPKFSSGYPVVSVVADTRVTLTVSMNEPSVVFAVALLSTAAASMSFSPSDVLAATQGVDGGEGSFLDTYTLSVPHPNVALVMTLHSLPHTTNVTVLMFARDISDASNAQAAVTGLELATIPDATAPKFVSDGAPKVLPLSDTSVQFAARLDEACTVFVAAFLNLPDSSLEWPTVSDILHAQQGEVGAQAGLAPVWVGQENATIASDFNVTATITQLPHDARIGVCAAAVDVSVGSNAQVAAACTFGRTLQDATPPVLVWDTPGTGVVFVSDSSVRIGIGANEACLVSWVVTHVATSPVSLTTSDVVSPVPGGDVVAVGTTPTAPDLDGSFEGEFWVYGLEHGTNYSIHLVGTDLHSNAQISVTSLHFTTLPDATPPVFLSPAPTLVSSSDNSLTFSVQLNEPATVFAAAIRVADLAKFSHPTPTQVRSGDGVSFVAAASADTVGLVNQTSFNATATLTGIGHSEAVVVYIVAQDMPLDHPPNLQNPHAMVNFSASTQDDASPPMFLAGFPHSTLVTDVSFSVSVVLNEPGQAFVVVVPVHVNAAAPSSHDIVTENVATDFVVGTTSLVGIDASDPQVLHLTGLAHATAFDVFVVARDNSTARNIQVRSLLLTVSTVLASPKREQERPVHFVVSTQADQTPPVFALPGPTGLNVSDSSAVLVATLSESGTIHCVVVARSEASRVSTLPHFPVMLASGHFTDAAAVLSRSFVARGAGVLEVLQLPHVLEPDTDYSALIVGADRASPPNVQTLVSVVEFTTVPDQTPPVFVPVLPRVVMVTDTAATLLAAMNEPGMLFFVVLPAGLPQPSPLDIVAGDVPQQRGFGSRTTFSADAPQTVQLSNLNHSSMYDVYFVARDASSAANIQDKATLVVVQTQPDASPPEFVELPRFSDITDSSVKVTITTDEPASNCVMLCIGPLDTWPLVANLFAWCSDEVPLPSPACLVTRTTELGAGNPFVQTHASVELHNLPHATRIAVYLAASDGATPPNKQGVVTALAFTTRPDATPPAWLSSSVVDIVSDSGCNVTGIALSEEGTVFAMALPAGHPVPDFPYLASGLLAAGVPADWSGTVVVPAAVPSFLSVQGLHHDTAYDVVLWAADMHDPANIQRSPRVVSVRTLPDSTPPKVAQGYPRVSVLGETMVDITMQLNEPGVVTGVLKPAASIASGNETELHVAFAIDVVEGGIERGVEVNGLRPNTTYIIEMWVRDKHAPSGNMQPKPVVVTLMTAIDAQAPSWVGTPGVVATNETWIAVGVSTSEASMVWAAAFDVASQPTVDIMTAQIVDWKHPARELSQWGAVAVATATTSGLHSVPYEEVITLHGLQGSKNYTVWLLARDFAYVPNAMASPATMVVSTTTDLSPPTFVDSWPRIVRIASQEFAVEIAASEACTVDVHVMRKSGLLFATVTVFRAQVAVPQAGQPVQLLVEGLEPSSLYSVVLLGTDQAPHPNTMHSPILLTAVTLADTTPPRFVVPPRISATDTAATALLRMDEPGTVAWVVMEARGAVVGVAWVGDWVESIALGDSANEDPHIVIVATGHSTITSADVEAQIPFPVVVADRLASSTRYVVAFVARDARTPHSNLQVNATTVSMTTAEGELCFGWQCVVPCASLISGFATASTIPTFHAGFPSISSVSDSWVMLEAKLDRTGVVAFAAFEDHMPSLPPMPNSSALLDVVLKCHAASCGTVSVVAPGMVVFAAARELKPVTQYILLVTAVDGTGAGSGTWTLRFTTKHATAPSFMAGFPRVRDVTARSMRLDVQLNEPGVVAMAVFPAGDANVDAQATHNITVDALVHGVEAAGRRSALPNLNTLSECHVEFPGSVACGALTSPSVGVVSTWLREAMTPGRAYSVFFAARDLQTPPAVQRGVTVVPLSTPLVQAQAPRLEAQESCGTMSATAPQSTCILAAASPVDINGERLAMPDDDAARWVVFAVTSHNNRSSSGFDVALCDGWRAASLVDPIPVNGSWRLTSAMLEAVHDSGVGAGAAFAVIRGTASASLQLAAPGAWRLRVWTCASRQGASQVATTTMTIDVPHVAGDATVSAQPGGDQGDGMGPVHTLTGWWKRPVGEVVLGVAVVVLLCFGVERATAMAGRSCCTWCCSCRSADAKRGRRGSAAKYTVHAMTPNSAQDSVADRHSDWSDSDTDDGETRRQGNDNNSDDDAPTTPMLASTRSPASASASASASTSTWLGFGSPVPWAKRVLRSVVRSPAGDTDPNRRRTQQRRRRWRRGLYRRTPQQDNDGAGGVCGGGVGSDGEDGVPQLCMDDESGDESRTPLVARHAASAHVGRVGAVPSSPDASGDEDVGRVGGQATQDRRRAPPRSFVPGGLDSPTLCERTPAAVREGGPVPTLACAGASPKLDGQTRSSTPTTLSPISLVGPTSQRRQLPRRTHHARATPTANKPSLKTRLSLMVQAQLRAAQQGHGSPSSFTSPLASPMLLPSQEAAQASGGRCPDGTVEGTGPHRSASRSFLGASEMLNTSALVAGSASPTLSPIALDAASPSSPWVTEGDGTATDVDQVERGQPDGAFQSPRTTDVSCGDTVHLPLTPESTRQHRRRELLRLRSGTALGTATPNAFVTSIDNIVLPEPATPIAKAAAHSAAMVLSPSVGGHSTAHRKPWQRVLNFVLRGRHANHTSGPRTRSSSRLHAQAQGQAVVTTPPIARLKRGTAGTRTPSTPGGGDDSGGGDGGSTLSSPASASPLTMHPRAARDRRLDRALDGRLMTPSPVASPSPGPTRGAGQTGNVGTDTDTHTDTHTDTDTHTSAVASAPRSRWRMAVSAAAARGGSVAAGRGGAGAQGTAAGGARSESAVRPELVGRGFQVTAPRVSHRSLVAARGGFYAPPGRHTRTSSTASGGVVGGEAIGQRGDGSVVRSLPRFILDQDNAGTVKLATPSLSKTQGK